MKGFNKIVSNNLRFRNNERMCVDKFVYALALLGLADYEWVDESYVLRREVKTSVNYVMRATAHKLFNDGGRTEYHEDE